METRNGHYIFMINRNLKILHTAFLYCTGLTSSNITRNSVLSPIFDTARNAYCILRSDQITRLIFILFMVVGAGTEQEETVSSDKNRNSM